MTVRYGTRGNPYPDSAERRRKRQRDRARERYATEPGYREKMRIRNAKFGPEFTKRMRKLVLEHYGKFCACCGENETRFLTVDHVNRDGHEHRKQIRSTNVNAWLVRHDFPHTVKIQILCFNCNMAREFNGGVCPHKEK